MKTPHPIVLLILALGLAGCAHLRNDNAPTIADLGKRAPKLEDQPLAADEQQAMAAYRRFLATADQTEARPQAMRRLADINLEREANPAADTVADAGALAQPARDSILLYRQVLETYPDRPDNDKVLYQLARAYELDGQPAEALAELSQLVGRYPQSSYREEAQFRRGEIEFVRTQYAASAEAYRAVVEAGAQGAFYEQALYKLGWCYFKQGLYEESNATFLVLLDRKLAATGNSTPAPAQLNRAEQERIDDTLRAMSLGFSYEDGHNSITTLFERHGDRPYEDVVYARLGQLYLEKERYTDAAQTFQSFVDHNESSDQAPAFQMRVIDAYQAGGFPSLVLDSKKDFVRRYNLQGDYWQHHEQAQAGEVLGFLKATLIDLTRHYHAQAQQSHKAADYAEAGNWYRSFLGSFPDSPEAPGLNFLLADLLYESGDYVAAAHEYVHTAYDYGEHRQAAESGYAAVLAFAKAEPQLEAAQRSDWHRQGIENALRFAGSFPQHPQALAVLTHSAGELLALRDNTRAIQVARLVTGNAEANREQQRIGWTVQAHAWFDLQDYLQAEQAYQQVLARTDPDSPEKPALIEKLAASIYKQGEAAQAAGDPATAVAHFQRVRTAAPGASIVATAQYDAAAAQLQLQDWQSAAASLRDFRAAFPDDPRQAEVTRRLASAYLQGAQTVQAAQEFERMGHDSGASALRRDALWQAADLYVAAGNTAAAGEVYRYYVGQFPDPVEPAIEARHKLAIQAGKDRAVSEQEHWLTEIIRADAQAGNMRTDRTRYLAATARLALADNRHAQYRSVALRLPLKQSLQRKKQLLQDSLAQYEQAAAYGVAEVTTAAAYRTAQAYSELAGALMDSERPGNLDAAALEEYDVLLEDQAYPFEEQAIALHETNAARMDDGLYDAWIGKSLQALATLVPARYGKQERGASHVATLR
jgi:TolA-binding protein